MIFQEDKDRKEMLAIAAVYGKGMDELNASRFWLVFRRGMPARPMRVAKHTRNEKKAYAYFEKLAAGMRQGCVGLVDPNQAIVSYACAPMVRTRW